MSVERDIIDELDVVLTNIRRAEQNFERDTEETIKSIKSEITIPTLDITEDTRNGFSPKQSRESEEK